MSLKLMSRVWSSAPYGGDQLLILLAIADFANDEGFFFASKSTLAKKCRCSEEYVRKTLRKFCEDGVISVTKMGGGRGKATEFRFIKAVDNFEKTPNYEWNLAPEKGVSETAKPPTTDAKPPTMSAKPPTTLGDNSTNNSYNNRWCDFHNNPQPCTGCASEAKAGMCISCHQSECSCARFQPC